MKLRIKLTVAVLTTASALYACSSSSAKKSDAPPPPAGDQNADQPAAPESAENDPASQNAKQPTPAEAEMQLRKKIVERYDLSVRKMITLPADGGNADAEKALDEHLLAIECGVHVHGEQWPDLQRDLLRKILDTPEKQEKYVRAQGARKGGVLELRPTAMLDGLCK